jgi:hypothetical protein
MYKPLDFVETPEGAVAIISNVDYEGKASIEFLYEPHGDEPNAWWNPGMLEVINSLPRLLARMAAHPFSSNGGAEALDRFFPIGEEPESCAAHTLPAVLRRYHEPPHALYEVSYLAGGQAYIIIKDVGDTPGVPTVHDDAAWVFANMLMERPFVRNIRIFCWDRCGKLFEILHDGETFLGTTYRHDGKRVTHDNRS